MQQRQTEAPFSFMLDGHWNAEGVKIAAGSLAEQWRKLDLPLWASQKVKSTHRGI